MIVKGIEPRKVALIIAAVSVRNFGGNLQCKREPEAHRGAVRFTLRVESAAGPGHRIGFFPTRSGKSRRLAAACFHAYGEVIRALLDAGALWVQSAPMRRFRDKDSAARPMKWTKETWAEHANAMAQINIGSDFQPMIFCEACQCGQDEGMPDHALTQYAACVDWKPVKQGRVAWPIVDQE